MAFVLLNAPKPSNCGTQLRLRILSEIEETYGHYYFPDKTDALEALLLDLDSHDSETWYRVKDTDSGLGDAWVYMARGSHFVERRHTAPGADWHELSYTVRMYTEGLYFQLREEYNVV